MEKYKKISILGAIITLIFIYFQSSLVFSPRTFGFSYTSVLYHFGIFAILAIFLIYSSSFKKEEVLIAVLISLTYAGLDELHQYFVPGRVCSIYDFMIDFYGIVFGLIFVFIWNWICERYSFTPTK